VTLQPRTKREPFGATTCSGRITLAVRESAADAVGEGRGRGRLVALPALGMRNADAGLLSHELDRAAARGVDHR
jgi:hypothetical protein